MRKEEAAALAAAHGGSDGQGLGDEKVSIEEHMRRMLAEGAATSVIWNEAHSRPLV